MYLIFISKSKIINKNKKGKVTSTKSKVSIHSVISVSQEDILSFLLKLYKLGIYKFKYFEWIFVNVLKR